MLTDKYRPRKFADVLGQDLAKRTLTAIAKADGIKVRSIILQGPHGSGKTSMSRLMGAACSCENFNKLNDICGECEGCKEAYRPNSQSYLEFDSTRVGNIESVKSLIDQLYISPYSGRRVVVLDEAHTVSRAALNSLLKVLEEGIPNTLWIFCSTEEILKTIRSRSIFLEVNTIPPTQMIPYISDIAKSENIDITEQQLSMLARKSNGHMRDAVSLLEHFKIAGEDALMTSYHLVREYFLACLKKDSTEEVINKLLTNTLIDVNLSISEFLINTFKGLGDFEKRINEKGIHRHMFKFFYQPEVQQALKDEDGLHLVLRAFSEQLK